MHQDTMTQQEHQELVLMLGSKKGWQTYLGLEEKQARLIWTSQSLRAPAEYVRSVDLEELSTRVLSLGHKKAAIHYGLSESALRSILKERGLAEKVNKPEFEKDELELHLRHYRSVRFAARMLGTTESWIRQEAARHDIDAKLLIDWSVGNNANAKGRRAEQEFARLRGAKITKDMNLTDGSQADYDFEDEELGRVNVKSSSQYRYKAQTRKASPNFWKFSMNGCEKCDHLVLMCYDEKMENLVGMLVMEAPKDPATRTITILREQMEPASKWTTS